MQPRSLDQILAELNPTYQPQIQSLQQQAADIPNQIAQQETGLNAKKDSAFGDILNGARRRGLGFSGIPLSEQAQYTATDYLPALANLRQQGNQRAQSLQDAILGINERRDTLAQQLRTSDQDRAEQIRQFNASLAEQRASRAASSAGGFNPSYGGGNPPAGSNLPQGVSFKNAGAGGAAGYNFNFGGSPVSAARYAQLSGGDLRNLLYNLGNSGDKTAARALQDLIKSNGKWTTDIKRKYSSLFWGV